MDLLDNKKHLILLIPLFLFNVLSLTLFDRYWKIAIVLAIVSFCGCILIGTLVFIRHTESTRESTRLRSFGINQDPVAEYKTSIGSIINKVEKILLYYCLTIISGFFLSILLFLFINKWVDTTSITNQLSRPTFARTRFLLRNCFAMTSRHGTAAWRWRLYVKAIQSWYYLPLSCINNIAKIK